MHIPAKQSHCAGHVNKSANKRRRKLVTRDHAIASAIVEFSKFVKEIQKLKLQMMERITSQILV